MVSTLLEGIYWYYYLSTPIYCRHVLSKVERKGVGLGKYPPVTLKAIFNVDKV